MTDSSRTALVSYPAPLPLDPGYDRHAPAPERLRATLGEIGSGRDWAAVGWPELITALLALGRTDVPLSRLAEGHVDALRIFAQADARPVPDALYGVWASRSQRTGVQGRWVEDRLILEGTIRFASGAGLIDRSLVPVWLASGEHLLVDLAVRELPIETGQWVTAAMEVSRSHTIPVDQVSVTAEDQVGPPNFYLDRPGFFPGGVGVAACWAGGAARVADLTHARVPDRSPALRARLGRIRIELATAAALVLTAARRLDDLLAADTADPIVVQAVSTETRAGVAAAVHAVLEEAHRVAGPAGLAYDEDLTRVVHDLRLYVLQQNADGDEQFLGGLPG